MRTLIGVAAAALAAVSLGVWLKSATQSATEISSVPEPATASRVSIWDIHNQAHLEFLPVQQVDDQSMIFTQARRD
jgi:hypothetical protein